MMTISPGLDVAHEVGADDVERAGLRRDDPGIAEPAQHQRPHAQGIAHGDHACPASAPPANRRPAPGAARRPCRSSTLSLEAGRDEMDDDFGVAGRLEQAAAAHELAAHVIGIGEVAVVADGEPAELEIGEQRLHVAHRHLAGRGIAHVADGRMAAEPPITSLELKFSPTWPMAAMGVELLAVIGDDAGRFLAAMLQRMEAERRQRRRFGMAEDAEHAALLVQMVVVQRIAWSACAAS